MAANTNVKVGLTTTIFGALVIGSILWLSNFDPTRNNYQIQGNFRNVGGLIPGSKVYLMGVEIGKVTATVPELNKVRVLMEINEDVKIPVNTRMTIAAKGLVGDKSVEFFINDEVVPTTFYKPGAILDGSSPASFEDLIVEGRKAMQKANALIGDPELNKNIRLTSKNIELFTRKLNGSITQLDQVMKDVKNISVSATGFVGRTNVIVEEINSFVKDIRGAAAYNRGNIDSLIANANGIAKSLNRTANTLNQLVDNPQNRGEIRNTVDSIRRAASNIEKISSEATLISSDIRNVTGDKEIKDNLKSIVENTKVISGTFAKTLSIPGQDAEKDKEKDKKDRLNIEFRSEVLGKLTYQFNNPSSTPAFEVIGNFNMLAHTGFANFPFVQLGIEEIGARNQLNIQAGFYPLDNLRVRLGILRGKLGVGGNYLIEKSNTDIIAEFYDIGSPHIRFGVLQNIYKEYGLSAYWDNQIFNNTNEFVLGVRWQPNIF